MIQIFEISTNKRILSTNKHLYYTNIPNWSINCNGIYDPPNLIWPPLTMLFWKFVDPPNLIDPRHLLGTGEYLIIQLCIDFQLCIFWIWFFENNCGYVVFHLLIFLKMASILQFLRFRTKYFARRYLLYMSWVEYTQKIRKIPI